MITKNLKIGKCIYSKENQSSNICAECCLSDPPPCMVEEESKEGLA